VTVVLLLAAGACAQQTNSAGDGGTEEPAAPAAPPELAFTIADQGVTNVPQDISAGINTLTVTNEGKDKHFPAIARINDGVKKQKVGLALADQDFETFFTSAVVAGTILEGGKPNLAPGATGTLTTELPEGTYLLVDPEAKRFEPGYFDVGPPSDESVAAPEADYEVVEAEYEIKIPDELEAGSHTFALTNAGEQGHEFNITSKDGEKDVAYALAPVPGSTAWVTFDLKPGKYLVACYFPDVKDGKLTNKNHFKLGMKATITVR
jgi:uncharacterized cupredoxin-like copper-binding protein